MDKIIKRQVLAQPQKLIVIPPPGLTEICQGELDDLISKPLQDYKFKAQVDAEQGRLLVSNLDYRQGIELVLRITTAADVLIVLAEAHVGSFKELQGCLDKVKVQWYLTKSQSYRLNVKSYGSKLYHEGKISELAAKHLDQKGYQCGEKGVPLQILQKRNRIELSLSLGGQPLYQRRFKQALSTLAPLKEHFAAALLRSLPLDKASLIYLPFAGSGTLAFEAVAQIQSLAPARWRAEYALESMPCTPEATINYLRQQLGKPSTQSITVIARDISEQQVEEIKANLVSWKDQISVDESLWSIEQGDFFHEPGINFTDHKVILPLNPPYGLRLGQGDPDPKFFARLGQAIVAIGSKCQQLDGFCLVPDSASFDSFTSSLKGMVEDIRHINQGGLHIRAVYFSSRS